MESALFAATDHVKMRMRKRKEEESYKIAKEQRYIFLKFAPTGGGQKTCTFGENQGRKPVPDRFFLFYTRKFGVLNIFRKIVA